MLITTVEPKDCPLPELLFSVFSRSIVFPKHFVSSWLLLGAMVFLFFSEGNTIHETNSGLEDV